MNEAEEILRGWLNRLARLEQYNEAHKEDIMRKTLSICLGLLTIAAIGCVPGEIRTSVQITDNCTLGVLYDNGTAKLDVNCNNE
ncbi:MAG: hypothetical protein HQK97_07565 [Nitrospirae bacterium]|nr:hypothetical protein [Nitrospirota bacterium]